MTRESVQMNAGHPFKRFCQDIASLKADIFFDVWLKFL